VSSARADRTPAAEPAREDAPGEARVRRYGPLGRITLDRPRKINALTPAMVQRIRHALLRWEEDPRIARVLIDGHGERGFCAGGDIGVVHEAARDRTDAAERLWREEYLLDALVADYRKPVISVMDGIAMGGGVGLGAHASHRLVTERSVLAMPEVRIGISPDVGALLLFARAPGLVGKHLAMTGDRFGPGDAVGLGFADAVVPSGRLGPLLALLVERDANDAIDAVRSLPPAAPLLDARSWIDACYAGADPVEIVARLRAAGSDAAARAADRIEAVSPLAVWVTVRALAEAGRLGSLSDVLAQDLRVGLRFLEGTDPVEGITAVLFDKGRSPSWSPPTLADVDSASVNRHFVSLGDAELDVRRDLRRRAAVS
jgi:enoyl-CoA hydratase